MSSKIIGILSVVILEELCLAQKTVKTLQWTALCTGHNFHILK